MSTSSLETKCKHIYWKCHAELHFLFLFMATFLYVAFDIAFSNYYWSLIVALYVDQLTLPWIFNRSHRNNNTPQPHRQTSSCCSCQKQEDFPFTLSCGHQMCANCFARLFSSAEDVKCSTCSQLSSELYCSPDSPNAPALKYYNSRFDFIKVYSLKLMVVAFCVFAAMAYESLLFFPIRFHPIRFAWCLTRLSIFFRIAE